MGVEYLSKKYKKPKRGKKDKFLVHTMDETDILVILLRSTKRLMASAQDLNSGVSI